MEKKKNYTEFPNIIFDLPLSYKAKVVCIALWSFADEEGCAYPSQEEIADRCGSSKSTVKRAVIELVNAGMVTVTKRLTEHGGRDSNQYQLHPEPIN